MQCNKAFHTILMHFKTFSADKAFEQCVCVCTCDIDKVFRVVFKEFNCLLCAIAEMRRQRKNVIKTTGARKKASARTHRQIK